MTTTRLYDGIHLYRRREGGLIEHTIDNGNDIVLTIVGEVETLMGWPTEAMVECEDDTGARHLVGCDRGGNITEINNQPLAITTLDELLDVLANAPAGHNSDEIISYAKARGLRTTGGEIDMASLPTFGGIEPADTNGIFSWDARRLLVFSAPMGAMTGNALQACANLRIINR